MIARQFMSDAQRYVVVERIAAGGMAEVFRGESAGIEGFRKKVAIKRVLPKLSANRDFIRMFLDEARLCAYLSHSRCVQVFDIGQSGGAHFIVMEFVDGADLKAVLEYLAAHGQKMSVEVASRITLDICEGLAYAHQATDHGGSPLNIVHRDISPHNVLITRYGEVKLVDFGLAKASSHLTDDDEDIVKGKFGYLAPEVTLGKGADKRVDIFAAGILFWEMLAGRRLFLGDTDVETFKLVRAANVPDIRQIRPDVPEDVARVLAKALSRDPETRYQTADDFARDLSLVVAKQARPVSYQDVAKLVRDAAAERARRDTAEKSKYAGSVGDLILDALHDFGAGGDVTTEATRLGTIGIQASREDFVNPSEWGLDALFDSQPPKASHAQADKRAAPAPAATQASPRARPTADRTPERPAAPPQAETVQRREGAQPQRAVAAKPPPKPAQQQSGAASAAERARSQEAAAKKDGPFWRRWFGGT